MTPLEFLDVAFVNLRKHIAAHYGMGTEDGDGAVQSFDCSAWIWDCRGELKHDRNTDWILGDASGKQTKFKAIASPVPGCVAVYGTLWSKGQRHAGHVGIVVEVARKLVLDCSSGQDGPAVHKQAVLFDGPSDGRKVMFCIAI